MCVLWKKGKHGNCAEEKLNNKRDEWNKRWIFVKDCDVIGSDVCQTQTVSMFHHKAGLLISFFSSSRLCFYGSRDSLSNKCIYIDECVFNIFWCFLFDFFYDLIYTHRGEQMWLCRGLNVHVSACMCLCSLICDEFNFYSVKSFLCVTLTLKQTYISLQMRFTLAKLFNCSFNIYTKIMMWCELRYFHVGF